jgi:hypothetical protein
LAQIYTPLLPFLLAEETFEGRRSKTDYEG